MSDLASKRKTTSVADDISAEGLGVFVARRINEDLPDSDELLMELGLNLVRASGKFVTASEGQVLRKRKLRWASFSSLFMASLFDGVEARTISRLAGVTRQATSLVLQSLEKAELISRQTNDPNDKRLIEVSLTDEGRRTVHESMKEQMQLSEHWFSRLSKNEQRELNRLLRKLLTGRESD